MNRRVFLARVTAGVVGAAALAKIPAAVIQAAPRLAEPARVWACERMRRVFHAYVVANQQRGVEGSLPVAMRVGQDFFTLCEGELQSHWRLTTTAPECRGHDRTLRFKGVPVYVGSQASAYHCEAVAVVDFT